MKNIENSNQSTTELSDLELIAKYKLGDEDAFLQLVERYMPLMLNCIKNVKTDRYSKEDFLNEMTFKMHKVLSKYDATKKASLGTFLKICFTNHIRDLLKKKEVKTSSIDEDRVVIEDTPEILLIAKEEKAELLNRVRGILSHYEFQVFEKWIVESQKTRHIAQALNRSAKSIDNTKARIKLKIKNAMLFNR